MKQEEALNKWCPFSTITMNNVGAANNRGEIKLSSTDDLGINCLASGCMAWQTLSNDTAKGGYCGLVK